jgi:hypothetical protein
VTTISTMAMTMMAAIVMGVAVGAVMALMTTLALLAAERIAAALELEWGARTDAGVCEGDGAVKGWLSRAQKSAAGGGTLYKRAGEPRNDGMGEAFFGHAALDVGNMVGELFCEFIYALNNGIGIDVQLFG